MLEDADLSAVFPTSSGGGTAKPTAEQKPMAAPWPCGIVWGRIVPDLMGLLDKEETGVDVGVARCTVGHLDVLAAATHAELKLLMATDGGEQGADKENEGAME